MGVLAEVFVANHAQALRHSESLDAGNGGTVAAADRVDLGGLTDLEIERLIEIAAEAVHAGGVDPTFEMVDVEYDSVLEIPAPAARVLVALGHPVEQSDGESLDVLPAVAATWAEDEDVDVAADIAQSLVRRLVGLADAAASRGGSLYLWWSL